MEDRSMDALEGRRKEDLEKARHLLKSARNEPKGNFNVYNAYRNQLNELYLSSEVYEKSIKELCKVLKI